MDHKTLIASLPADTRRALCTQSDGPAILRLGLHLGAIAALGWAIAAGVPFWWALLLPQGLLLVFLFTALHETIHKTAFKTGWANDLAATLCGLAVLLPPTNFRYFHFAHHRHTHDPAHDPELASPKPETARDYAIYLSSLLEWRWRIVELIKNALGPNRDVFVPPRARGRIRAEAIGFLALYALGAALAAQTLLWVWAVPMLLGAPFLRAYLLAEHTFCPHVADMLANTRTTFTHRAVRWLAWNMPYHAEHHAYPAVPFHRLPHFHAIARDRLKETQDGYAPFAAGYLDRARREAAHAS